MRRVSSATGSAGGDLRPGLATLAGGLLLALLLSGCQAPDTAVAQAPTAPPAGDKMAPPPKVLGLQPEDVQDLLGVPKLVRREAPAEVWQYRSTACVLDVFLYPEDTGAQQVRYLEARTAAAEPALTDDCVNDIRRTNRVPT